MRPQRIAQVCIGLLESFYAVPLRAKANIAIALIDGEADAILLQALGERKGCEAGADDEDVRLRFWCGVGIATVQIKSSERLNAKVIAEGALKVGLRQSSAQRLG